MITKSNSVFFSAVVSQYIIHYPFSPVRTDAFADPNAALPVRDKTVRNTSNCVGGGGACKNVDLTRDTTFLPSRLRRRALLVNITAFVYVFAARWRGRFGKYAFIVVIFIFPYLRPCVWDGDGMFGLKGWCLSFEIFICVLMRNERSSLRDG